MSEPAALQCVVSIRGEHQREKEQQRQRDLVRVHERLKTASIATRDIHVYTGHSV